MTSGVAKRRLTVARILNSFLYFTLTSFQANAYTEICFVKIYSFISSSAKCFLLKNLHEKLIQKGHFYVVVVTLLSFFSELRDTWKRCLQMGLLWNSFFAFWAIEFVANFLEHLGSRSYFVWIKVLFKKLISNVPKCRSAGTYRKLGWIYYSYVELASFFRLLV